MNPGRSLKILIMIKQASVANRQRNNLQLVMAPRDLKKDDNQNQKSPNLSIALTSSKIVAQRKVKQNQIRSRIPRTTANIVYCCPQKSVEDPNTDCDYVVTRDGFLSGKAVKHFVDVHQLTSTDIANCPEGTFKFKRRIVKSKNFYMVKFKEIGKTLEEVCTKLKDLMKTKEDINDVSLSMDNMSLNEVCTDLTMENNMCL